MITSYGQFTPILKGSVVEYHDIYIHIHVWSAFYSYIVIGLMCVLNTKSVLFQVAVLVGNFTALSNQSASLTVV